MFRTAIAFGLACIISASAAHAAPHVITPMPLAPATANSAVFHEAGYHRHNRHYRHNRHHRPHYRHHRPHYHHSAPRVYHGYSQAHYNWCAAKYRSYNRHNNTWRAHSGKVYQCRSPY